MHLPWNKKYIEISFHVILTAGILVFFGALLFHIKSAKNVIFQTIQHILSVFAPVFWSIGIAILLEPFVQLLQKQYEQYFCAKQKQKNRRMGTILAYLIVFLFFGIFGTFCVHWIHTANFEILVEQLENFVQFFGDWLILLQLKLSEYGLLQNIESMVAQVVSSVSMQIKQFFPHIAALLSALGGQLVHVLIGFVAAFYFLSEKYSVQHFLKQIGTVFCGQYMTQMLGRGFSEIYRIWIGYLSGQFLDACIMGILFAATFQIIGIPYGIVIGLISGFSNLIPYLGAIVAFFLAVLSGLLSPYPIRSLYAAISILLLQQLDSAVIVPKLIGKRVELHPVLVLFSLAIFGGFFGFFGLFFAVPLGAISKELFFLLYEKQKAKHHISTS